MQDAGALVLLVVINLERTPRGRRTGQGSGRQTASLGGNAIDVVSLCTDESRA